MPLGYRQSDDFDAISSYITAKRLKELLLVRINIYIVIYIQLILIKKDHFYITILVVNFKATQMKYNGLILEAILDHTDSRNMLKKMAEYVKVNCKEAALLRLL